MLGEVGTFTKGAPLSKADISEEGTPFILYGELYTTYNEVTNAIVRKTDKAADLSQYSRIGDVIIPTSGETPEEIATATCVMLPNVILAGDLNIFRGTKVDGRIISYIVNHVINRDISRIAQGKSVVHVKADELSKIRINYPNSEEQKKLIRFLEILSGRIEKQRQLVELLKSYKRGVSTALFTQKLRLSKTCLPHNTEWSKKYLGDIFSERTERAAGNERLLAVTINYGVQDRTELDLKDNSSDDKRNYRVVHIGDLAYNTMRMWQGACGVSAFDGIVSPAYTVLYITDNTENYAPFWGYYFKETSMLQTFQRNSQGLTSDTWNLKYEKFAHISVYAPPFQEQLQIADFLDRISDKIAANENFLNSLVKFKCGLLSLLFI